MCILLIEPDDNLRASLKCFIQEECKLLCLDTKDLEKAFSYMRNVKFTHLIMDYQIGDDIVTPIMKLMSLSPPKRKPIYIMLIDQPTDQFIDIDHIFNKPLTPDNLDQLCEILTKKESNKI